MAPAFEPKIVAIHQPNYFPWLGYFYKIVAADVFVFHDMVEHSKRYPTRRTSVRKSANGDEAYWLTVPLKKHSDFALIKDLEIDHSQDWPGKHLRKLQDTYQRAPFGEPGLEKLKAWFAQASRFQQLADWNIFLIKNLMEALQIERQTMRSSALDAPPKGALGNISIVKQVGGTSYLSGAGGANYQSESDFSTQNIQLVYSDYNRLLAGLPHGQAKERQFCLSLSMLDALFNIGEAGLRELLHQAVQPSQKAD